MIQLSSRFRQILAGAALFAVGGGVGAAVTHAVQPALVMAAAPPTSIAALAAPSDGWSPRAIATVRGRIAETYGNRFVIDDGSGRLLVELGRRGSDPALAKGQTVTVQGRAHDGVIRALYLVSADGHAYAFGGRGGHGPRGGRRDGEQRG